MGRRFVRWTGAALLLVSGVAWLQSGRELFMWEVASRPFAEATLVEQPIRFAGRAFEIVDDNEEDSVYSEEAFEGLVEVRVDGERLGAPSRALVRPGRARDDLGRYHLWADAWDFTDRRTGERTLWITRRIQSSDEEPRRFEVVTVSDEGEIVVRLLNARQLKEGWRTFRATQFLRSSEWSVYPMSMLDWGYFWPVLLVFPVGTTVLGIRLLLRGRS